MGSPDPEVRRLQLQRKLYLLKLKAKISYRGRSRKRQAEALYWLTRALGYACHPRHLDVIRHQNYVTFGERDADLTLGFRGLGKSTVGTIVRAIKYAIDDPNVRILFASDTQAAAERILREVHAKLQHSPDMIAMFGPFFGTERFSDRGRYRDSYATILQRTDPTISEATFTCIGVGGQAASLHFDVIFVDDLVTIRNSRTRKQRENVAHWHGSTLLGCCIETTRMHYIGTRYYPHDHYQVLVDGTDDEETGVLNDATLFIPALVLDKAGNEVTNYPERFTTEHLLRRRRKMGRYHFNAQMQQDTSSADGMVFRYSDFRWYGSDDADAPKVPAGLGIYQYTDLAAKRTDAGDYTAIVTIGITPGRTVAERQVYVLDLFRKRCGNHESRQAIVEAIAKWNPVSHGIEAVQMQAGFAQEMQERIDKRIKPCNVETDKLFRAYRVAPLVECGQTYFPMPDTPRGRQMDPLLDELCTMPDGEHDDCVDALVGAITLALFSGRPAAYGGGIDDEDDDGGATNWNRSLGLRGKY